MSTVQRKSRYRKGISRLRTDRNESGAGALLPIIIIGMIISVVAASIAGATSFAAKVSTQQVNQINGVVEARSLLNGFLDKALSTTLTPTGTVDGAGTYTVYYSSGAQPKTLTDTGVTALPSSGVPAGAKWLLVNMKPKTGTPQLAIFSFSPRGSTTFDHLINWAGTVTISNTTLGPSTGVQGPVSVLTGDSTATTSQTFTLSGSTLEADLYTDYNSADTTIYTGKLSGNVSSLSKIQFNSKPLIEGNVYSSKAIWGVGTVTGIQKANDAARPVVTKPNSSSIVLPNQIRALTAAECSTAAGLQSLLQSLTRDTTLTGGELCAAGSWNTKVSLKANVLIHSEKALVVNGLQVVGSTGSLGFSSAKSSLNLRNVQYSEGAKGQFLSAAGFTIYNSVLTGSISSYGTAGGTLNIGSSTVRYAPTASPLAGSCGTATCPMSSTLPHLVRVS